MNAASVFEHGRGQWRRTLEFFGGPPAEDVSQPAEQQRVAILVGAAGLLAGVLLPVPVVRRVEEDIDADQLPAGAPPVLTSLRPAPVVDLAEVTLPVLGVFHADGHDNPGGAL